MNKKLWEASLTQKRDSLLKKYEQFISKKFGKKFNGDYENILKWNGEAKKSGFEAGDYINELKIENT